MTKKQYITADCALVATIHLEPLLNESLNIAKDDEEPDFDGEFSAKQTELDLDFENNWNFDQYKLDWQ